MAAGNLQKESCFTRLTLFIRKDLTVMIGKSAIVIPFWM